MSSSKSCEYTDTPGLYLQFHSVSWCLAEGYGNEDQYQPISLCGFRKNFTYTATVLMLLESTYKEVLRTFIAVAVDVPSVGECKAKPSVVTIKCFAFCVFHLTTVNCLIPLHWNALGTADRQQSVYFTATIRIVGV